MTAAPAPEETVRSAYQALNAGDVSAFLAVCDEDIVIIEPPGLPFGGVYTGPKEFVGFLKAAGPHFAPGRLEVRPLAADGNVVLAHLSIGLANGNTASVVEIWTLSDGKAHEIEVLWSDPSMIDG